MSYCCIDLFSWRTEIFSARSYNENDVEDGENLPVSTPVSASRSAYARHMDKLRNTGGQKFVDIHKSAEAKRQLMYRLSLSGEKLQKNKELARIRQHNYITKKKEKNKPVKILTRKEKDKQDKQFIEKRLYWLRNVNRDFVVPIIL